MNILFWKGAREADYLADIPPEGHFGAAKVYHPVYFLINGSGSMPSCTWYSRNRFVIQYVHIVDVVTSNLSNAIFSAENSAEKMACESFNLAKVFEDRSTIQLESSFEVLIKRPKVPIDSSSNKISLPKPCKDTSM